MNRLTKSPNKVISGVLGGLAEYFGISAGWLRFGFVLLLFVHWLFWPLIIVYVIAAIVMPESDGVVGAETSKEPVRTSRRGLLFLGVVFILFGLFFLIDQILPFNLMYYFRYLVTISRDYLLAIVLIIIGLLFIFKSGNKKTSTGRRHIDGVTMQRDEVTKEDNNEDGDK
jgi:phage shock protein PspC (stress-responsive transcriptional regulator)